MNAQEVLHGDEFGSISKEKFDETYLREIKRDIERAQLFLKDIPANARRGLTIETLSHFKCGWLSDWVNTKNRAEWLCGTRELVEGKPKLLPPPSRRIIIPTPDMQHFNAVVPPPDRRAGDDKWCKVHAGTKSLFYDHKSLKGSDFIFVLEGEVDAMSVWQATNGKSAAVAILGRNGWRKSLLPKLKDLLKGKKFILMFDKDDGQIDSKNLCDTLIKMGIPAVSKYFFDFLTEDDKKYFGQKVDANKILVERGNNFLLELLRKIFAEARSDLKSVEETIQGQTFFSQQATNSRLKAVENFDTDNAQEEIRHIVPFIPVAKLDRDSWIKVGMIMKRYGLPFDEFNQWSKDDSRYDAAECKTQWNSFWAEGENNQQGYTIATLVLIAKEFGYVPHGKPKIEKQSTPIEIGTGDADLDAKIAEWQRYNGIVEPKLLSELQAAAKRIAAMDITAANVNNAITQRHLGYFKFYTFFSDVEENFFIRLSDAKDAANQKMRKFKQLQHNAEISVQLRGDAARKEIADATPSDADKSLVGIDITKIKNQVNTYLTQAKRNHKKYTLQREIDEINARRRAEHEAYLADMPSTQKMLPDCPVDLILPEGVFFTENGIRIVDFDKPAGRNGRPVIEACQNPIVPVRRFREKIQRGETQKTNDQYEVALKSGRQWQYIIVDGRSLLDARAVQLLANSGALISDPKFFAKYMAKIIAINERNGRLKDIAVYTQPGWHGDEFIYPIGNDDCIVKNGDFDYKRVFTPHGDKEKWLDMLNQILYHNPVTDRDLRVWDENGNLIEVIKSKEESPSKKLNLVAAMILGAAWGSPLIKPLGIRNPQLLLGFDSGNGKTAAAKFAASFFGDPDALVPTCNATFNYLEDLSVKLNDLFHAVDELQSAKKNVRENMDELVYNFAGGVTRGRADIQGNAKPTYRYRGCRIFTGEQTIINDASGQGAISRIFEIKKSELFEDSFAVALHNFTQEHYGFIGRQYTTEFIPNNLAKIKECFTEVRKALSSNDMLSNHATIIAYCITGLRFALEALGYENALAIAFDAFEASQELIDSAPSKKTAKNINRALPDLLSYIDSHPANFIRENSKECAIQFTPAESKTEVFGVKMQDGSVAIFPTVLRKILNELGYPSSSAIIRGFGEAHYFEGHQAKNKSYQKRMPQSYADWSGNTSWVYMLRPTKTLNMLAA